jgi:agmatinase
MSDTKNLEFVPQEYGFLGSEAQYLSDPKDAQVVVVPFGLEASVSYGPGTRTGPSAIIKASPQL